MAAEADKPESSGVEKIFLAALDLSPAERPEYLARACCDNHALRQRVDALLSADEAPKGFLPQEAGPRPSESISEQPGDTIGRYKLREQLGEGGCGLVYMAEQQEPVQRKVALKIIKLGMDTKQVVARFEAERQALALMDHPNISKVLDAGATRTGRPYFVMELVGGIKITDYCDQNHLTTRQRLDLFIQVCRAVQHAHQKGIIHRDIKPSNVLVAEQDGTAVPKVIDFGIAKATQGRLTDQTLFTAFEQFIGTPAYMSPEQARLGGLDVDTRSDIYSLGVLLYELLTGKTPFDSRELLAAGLDGMRRTIQEKEPPTPSTRLKQDVATQSSGQSQIKNQKSKIANDLDWIVMKCLEKDRSRRYETANGLGQDIERHLSNEPVAAGPPGRFYRFQKLLRRNRVVATAAALVGLVLALGVVASTWQTFRATRAERAQRVLRQEAQTAQANEARERSNAEQAAQLQAEERGRAESLAEENRVNLYAARIKLAEQTFKEGDVPRVLQLLDSLRPTERQTDLRSFEWYYLSQLCHSERLAFSGANGRLHCVTFSIDGRLLASAGDDGIIRLYDAASGVERAQLAGHQGRVSALAFCPDGKRLASAGADATVRLWDVAAGGELRALRASTNPISTLTFSHDGTMLAAGEAEPDNGSGNAQQLYFPTHLSGGISIWNTDNYEIRRRIEDVPYGVQALAFSPDAAKLALADRGHAIRLYDVATFRELCVRTNFSGTAAGVSFAPDGRELVAAIWFPWHDSGDIEILDAATLEVKRILVPEAGRVLCMALSPDGKRLASAGADRTARIWGYPSGDELTTFYGHGQPIISIAFAPDGRLLSTASWDRTVKVWDLEASPIRQRVETTQAFSVAFSPDGKLVASAGQQVEIRDARSGKLVRCLTGYTNNDMRVAFAPDGSTVAASGLDAAVHFWDTKDWQHWTPTNSLPREPKANFAPDNKFAFSPDSRTLAAADFDGRVELWDGRDGRLRGVLTNGTIVNAVAFTPDGQTLLTAGDLGRFSLWDTASMHLRKSLSSRHDLLRVSPDGQWIGSLGFPEIIIREFPSLRIRWRMPGHRFTTYCLAFSHDSRVLASASWDGTVKIWHLATGQELLTIPSLGGMVWSVAFSPDDRTLAFGSGANRKGSGAITLLHAANDAGSTNRKPTLPRPPSSHEILAAIPARPAHCPSVSVDISPYFNAMLTNSWISRQYSHNDLSSLKQGIVALGGTPFDIRGIVQLKAANELLPYDYPARVEGIRVARHCRALHFLQAAAWTEVGAVSGEYVIHFGKGPPEKVPLVCGENLENWFSFTNASAVLSDSTTSVWRGQNAASKLCNRELRLYDFRWENPHPEREIQSLDFASKLTIVAPFLLAITAEEP